MARDNVIGRHLDWLDHGDDPYRASDQLTGEEPKDRGPKRRGLKKEHGLIEVTREWLTVASARQILIDAIQAYRERGSYTTALVGALPPGVGKTTIGVATAEKAAHEGLRVLYLGPRHNFFQDVMGFAKRPGWWYEWLPRQEGDENGKIETCRYAAPMQTWLNRNYEAIAFCSNAKICGWEYVNNHCPYHAQKQVLPRRPIIFGQHKHLINHPLMEQIDLIIVDENPLDAFLHHWIIPGRHIMPPGMDPTELFTELIHDLASRAGQDCKADGQNLLALLGGPSRVREACDAFHINLSSKALSPNLRSAYDVDEAPYFHLMTLGNLLLREARVAETGRDYPPRVAIANGKLHLLIRHSVSAHAHGKPLICLDGTANEHLYHAILERPIELIAPAVKMKGRIFQVWPRANGKGTLVDRSGGLTGKAEQLARQVERIVHRHGYTRPAVITFETLKSLFDVETGHFYAARGTNRYEGCDCLIVAGTPQPNLASITETARMLFDKRMQPFSTEWSERDTAYSWRDDDGQARSYPVSGFWHDEDLQALLWQYREAEIIQAAHRIRPVRHAVDVWLLTNIPIDDLPPAELLTIADVFEAPGNVDPYRWPDLIALADRHYDEGKMLTAGDVTTALKVDAHTARKWLDLLVTQQPERWMRPPPEYVIPRQGRGRPAMTVVPNIGNHITNN